ncbi:trypsin-like peptidase domain-containing protein [Streptomyces monticola]|uniref:Trypsin-like peptidase domain-containing protein n=1 Tax=Streptomyces monticola TaxID=2666263 RepID=A0ABW2JHP6_9ACTN
MDEGKPAGPKAKWWSRPASRGRVPDEAAAQEPSAPDDMGRTGDNSPSTEAGSTTQEQPVQSVQPAQPGGPAQSAQSGSPAPSGAERDEAAAVSDEVSRAQDSAVRDAAPAPAVRDAAPTDDGAHSARDAAGLSGDRTDCSADPAHPSADRPKPLHDPDPYGTPPYGEPGPWAPAPPVQHPAATPAQGTPVPPQPAGTPPQGTPAPPYAGNPATSHTGAQQAPPHTSTQQAPHAGVPHPSPPPATEHGHGPGPGQGHSQEPYAPEPHRQEPHGHDPHGHDPHGQWQQYDPWRSPQPQPQPHLQHQPLLHPDGPGTAAARKPRRGRVFFAALVLSLVAGGIGGGIGAYMERNGGVSTVELPQADRESKERSPGSVAGIAASALPSVVTLHVSGGSAQGTGTGFVLDDKGHILTNNHVVEPAGDGGEGDISVTFSGGETAEAKVIGRDAGYDLAVVKVSGVSGLKPLPLGNSDNVQVGDPVVAIGAPFDLSNTVTSGIISAKERPITAGGEEGDGSDVSYVDALQTDAPINPGNSGGPLVDHKARVIGINSAIRSAGSGSELEGGQSGSIGLGFAIPINQAKRVAEELINTGKATHPVIEVTLDTKYTGDGARVAKQGADGSPAVSPGGPGDKAGIEPGDIVTEVDGQRVHSGEELIVKIRAHRPGDRLELTLKRGGDEKTLSLVLGAAGG